MSTRDNLPVKLKQHILKMERYEIAIDELSKEYGEKMSGLKYDEKFIALVKEHEEKSIEIAKEYDIKTEKTTGKRKFDSPSWLYDI